MPVRKITEQQFRTRRKDRRMVWVDAAALVVGLLVLTVSVGGIIVIEEEPQPIQWSYSFPEGKITQKWCIGTLGQQEGCKSLDSDPAPEGEEFKLAFDPITAPNVTQAVFMLTWTDDTPARTTTTDDDKAKYDYDNNSTDILRLVVVAPWGETFTLEGANVPDADAPAGEIQFSINISEAPEPGKYRALDQATVQRALMAEHTVTDHRALGEWQAAVTVVRAGDQNGTLPPDACMDVPPEVVSTLPDQVRRECNLDDNQQTLENNYGAGNLPDYKGTYVDTGNMWILEFYVRTYSSSVSF